ncbi:MAG: M15 family metallopeptidase [Tenacibaculum sp.]
MYFKTALLLIFTLLVNTTKLWAQLPKGFCYVKDIVPTIEIDLRYYTNNNFTGVPVKAYQCPVLISTISVAKALQKVQAELATQGLGLKIYDAYRPQTAVDYFVKWAKKISDTLMKRQYYPNIDKSNLFKLGYIASKSGHSRGSSVDLTLIRLNTLEELDMGSPYDFFGKSSHLSYTKLTQKQRKNRSILKSIMFKHGFKPYKNEWWHFSLKNEPFPKTYFDFPVK